MAEELFTAVPNKNVGSPTLEWSGKVAPFPAQVEIAAILHNDCIFVLC
jgi:hypothetical protein